MGAGNREPIAIVGIAIRFPGGISTPKRFWETLQTGLEVVDGVPKDRFDHNSFYDKDPQKYGTIRSRPCGFVDDQRLVLEASVHAVQDSGTLLKSMAGSRTGVFMGTFMYDHMAMQMATEQRDDTSAHVAMGSMVWATANRVSHRLHLQGPSITLDTACSSSLTALHLACQSIWTQESEGALAGGVNVILRPESSILLSKAGFLSPDRSCKPFDVSANGYVRSEGVGVVYLKSVSRALRDKDRIYASIRGSLVNQNGYTAEGFTVPSLAARVKLLETVYAQSGVDPTKVRYVEAHGPGTAIGDPIEASALGKKLGHARSEDEDSLWIGSGASGIIGFIKAALVTFYGEIPPQLNHRNPNPSINFKALRLAIPTERIILRRDRERKLLVGVNSFGAGGANVHVILEEAPSDMCTGTKISARGARVFVLSAKSQSAFAHAARDLASHLRSQKPLLEDVAYTLNMHRDKHAEISVIKANGLDDICGRLDQLGSEQASKETLTLQKLPGAPSPKVAFVFSGQGGQWLGMGMRLAYQEPIFRDYLAAFDRIFTPLAQFSIIAEIFAYPANDYKMTKTTIAQPAIAAIQVLLARTLISYGVKPDSCVGHSIGEIAAAHISGALSLEEAVKVIYFRSQIQNKAAGAGSMLAAGASAIEAENLIKLVRVSGKVEIAAFNGPKMTTLTGTVADLELVASELEKHGMFARFIKVDTPYHSHFMDHLEDELLKALASFRGRKLN
ncbi:Acyl transferase/acyl hydrolase/lysophospholipase [Penicillium desertorum]|uniref:Acyl transferase/acyl hydrolase/lysophospholipase n=1 Tax=Penicillium desertorum TaxID=1303715 RepID=A0A9X0BHN0_9EURO|nr:Acyl transferase/acyl hydrolase/lysophospholipase [Penicillium desertorum]